ncbi:PREDICTED: transmembrane protein 17B-like isoform X2 [Polistes dominula]|uniref:Transmembrane protein 17B-like isoform X2 n=1 Tax=Polistes dominula TaxID=743375 RepID=A0ABM1ILN0_POLDO|nr:PREDICTED: transmembrane protein 17B-like isoform X2 [Polistes dominula]
MWKSSVINASDHIFPGLAYHDRKKEFYDIGNQIQSSLPLQMALYFNYFQLTDVYKFITVAVFLLISVLECTRLYLGYLGNLDEKIPELASFWLISTLIQFPLELFILLDSRTMLNFTEQIINSVMIFFLSIEIIFGTIALKNSAYHHAKRFYIAQLYGIEDKFN